MGAKFEIIPPVKWLHVISHLSDETDARLSENAVGIGTTDIGFVAKQRGIFGQCIGQLMDWCQMVQ